MEYFDVIDDNGLKTGKTVDRETAHRCGIRHLTAHVWVVRYISGKPQILLQKRCMTKDSFPGCLDTSSAGHIPAGDSPRHSAVRELKEELGIEADEKDLEYIGSFENRYSMEFHGKPFNDNELSWVYLLHKDIQTDHLKLQKEEVESVEWQDYETVYQACCSHDPRYCVPLRGLKVIGKRLGFE